MRRWGTVALMLFAFVVGFASTYNCGGGTSAEADGVLRLRRFLLDVTAGPRRGEIPALARETWRQGLARCSLPEVVSRTIVEVVDDLGNASPIQGLRGGAHRGRPAR